MLCLLCGGKLMLRSVSCQQQFTTSQPQLRARYTATFTTLISYFSFLKTTSTVPAELQKQETHQVCQLSLCSTARIVDIKLMGLNRYPLSIQSWPSVKETSFTEEQCCIDHPTVNSLTKIYISTTFLRSQRNTANICFVGV